MKSRLFLQMIDERLTGVDQDKIRQEMQEQAKRRAKEALAVVGVEPAAEGQSFSFDPSDVLEREVHMPNKDSFTRLEQE